jgi:hypothetical protein
MKDMIERFQKSHDMPEEMAGNLQYTIRKNLKEKGYKMDVYFFQCDENTPREDWFYGWRIGVIGQLDLEKINECSPLKWEVSFESILKIQEGQQIILSAGSLQHVCTWNGVEWELTAVDIGDGPFSECMFTSPPEDYKGYYNSYEICNCPWCNPEMNPGDVDEYTFVEPATI